VFDHVGIRVADLDASVAFYRALLSPLGIEPDHVDDDLVEWGDFAIGPPDADHPVTRNLHVAFVAPSREHVDAAWRAAVEAGHADDGEPGERPQYGPTYYGGFLRDPDGNSAEAVHHEGVRPETNIDHLWIRVGDLDAAAAFYDVIAPFTGLRRGGTWAEGRQFRGPAATFSLIEDGGPRTEHLHLAFPAPDQATVQAFHRAAVEAGYRDHGGPGERLEYHPGYYGAYVLDPDGTNVESVFHGDR
jgi:catechol 2,3-dioxygenase-like lactoylglutathione lyase family enzyme